MAEPNTLPAASIQNGYDGSKLRALIERRMAQQAAADEDMPSTADEPQVPPAGPTQDGSPARLPDAQPPMSGYQIPAGDRSHLPDSNRQPLQYRGRQLPNVTSPPQRHELHWATDLPPEPGRSFPTAAQIGARMPGSVAIDRLQNPRFEIPAGEPAAQDVPPGPIRLPDTDRDTRVPPVRRPIQDIKAQADRREASAATDPSAAKSRAAAAVDKYKGGGSTRDYRKESADASEAQALTKDTVEFERAAQAHDARRMQLESQLEDAIQAGHVPLQQALREQLAAHQETAPKPSLRMTGGQTPEELAESIDATLGKLSPQERSSLDAQATKYATGQDGKVSAGSKQDWMWGQFADLPPAGRLQAMRAAAAQGQAPLQVASGGGIAGGRGSKVGDQATKKSAEASSRTDYDRRDGGYPVGKNAGMLVQNPDGSYSSRAPRMDHLNPLAGVEPDPDVQTPEWRQQMLAVGQTAFGLQRDKYAPGAEGDNMLIADAQKKLARHRQMIDAGFKVKPVVTGGYRYVPVKGGEAQQMAERAGRQAQTRNFLKANAVDPATAREMWNKADGGKAPTLQTQVLRDRDNDTRNALADDRQYKQLAAKMRDPAYAQQMLAAALEQAGTDPDAQALVYHQFGLPHFADRVIAGRNEALAAGMHHAQKMAEIAALGGKNKPDERTWESARKNYADARSALQEVGPAEGINLYNATHGALSGAKIENGDPLPFATHLLQMHANSGTSALGDMKARQVIDLAVGRIWNKWGGLTTPSLEQFVEGVAGRLGDTPEVRQIATEWYDRKLAPSQQRGAPNWRPPASVPQINGGP